MTIHLIPLAPGSKSPLAGQSWKKLVSSDPDVHRAWRRDGLNVGFPAGPNGAVIVDFDRKDVARAFYKKHCSIIGPLVETRCGIHVFFSGDTRPRKLIMNNMVVGDIRAGPTYVVYPDSTVRAWDYQFIRGHDWGELPPFPSDLFPERRIEQKTQTIRNVTSYVMRIESIEGKNGSAGLIRAIARCRDAGLSESEATILLLEWNHRANASN